MSISLTRHYSVHGGSLVLVGRDCPYREKEDELYLVPVGHENSGILLERHAAALLEKLLQAVKAGQSIAPVSGWRSYTSQRELYTACLEHDGEEFTKKYVAAPGHSEHHTGLAIDLALRQRDIDFIRPHFPDTGVCGAFRRAAPGYGFILRYPAGKEHITGIAHEPWHFRYVGVPHAQIITETGLTLEEYLLVLKCFHPQEKPLFLKKDTLLFAVYYVPKKDLPQALPKADEHFFSTISGNNQDGYIVSTCKECRV